MRRAIVPVCAVGLWAIGAYGLAPAAALSIVSIAVTASVVLIILSLRHR